ATGDHCPEGWTFYQYPGPGFQGIGENSAESSYYTWVDQHNTFGLGEDVPLSTGNLNDGLIALKDGKMIVLRVPYPLGFYAKGFDGRIDDAVKGGTFNSWFALYFLPMLDELDLSWAATSLRFSLARVEAALGGAFVGYLIDRFDVRVMLVVGTMLAGLGVVLLSFTP